MIENGFVHSVLVAGLPRPTALLLVSLLALIGAENAVVLGQHRIDITAESSDRPLPFRGLSKAPMS